MKTDTENDRDQTVLALAQEMFGDDWPSAVERLEQFWDAVRADTIKKCAKICQTEGESYANESTICSAKSRALLNIAEELRSQAGAT